MDLEIVIFRGRQNVRVIPWALSAGETPALNTAYAFGETGIQKAIVSGFIT